MSRALRLGSATLALVAAVTVGGPAALAQDAVVDAAAQPAPMSAAARAYLERGLARFEVQDYAGAIAELDAGYRLEPHGDFLYARAQARRLSGDCAGAVEDYRGFLRGRPPEQEAALARGNLEKCEARIRDEEARAIAARAEAARVEAARVRPGAEGRTATGADGDAAQAGAAPRAGEAPFYTDWVGDVLAGVGLAGIGAGGVLLGVAFGRASSAGDGTLGDYERDVEAAEDLRTASLVAFVAGGGFLAAGVVRFATRPSPRRAAALAVSLAPAAISLRGSF
jgi:hypothetical protein